MKREKWQLQLHHLEIEFFYPLLLCFRVVFYSLKNSRLQSKNISLSYSLGKNITFAFFKDTWHEQHLSLLYVTLCFRKSPPNISLQQQFKEMQTYKKSETLGATHIRFFLVIMEWVPKRNNKKYLPGGESCGKIRDLIFKMIY